MKTIFYKTFDIYKLIITITALILTGLIFLNINYSDYFIVKINEILIGSILLVPFSFVLAFLLQYKINFKINKDIDFITNIFGKFMLISFILNITLPYEIMINYMNEFNLMNIKNCVNLFLQMDSLIWMFFTHFIAPSTLFYLILSELYNYGKKKI